MIIIIITIITRRAPTNGRSHYSKTHKKKKLKIVVISEPADGGIIVLEKIDSGFNVGTSAAYFIRNQRKHATLPDDTHRTRFVG